MKKYFWIIIIALIIATLVGGFFVWRYYKNKKISNQTSSTASESTPPASTPTTTETPAPAPTVPTYVYPISNFASRATTNLFGTYFAPGGSTNPDREVCPNAKYYPGYHTAIDLETTESESSQDVPVFAIAAGTVRQVSAVSGYGGLIVVQYNLAGTEYIAYYGHINLSTAKVKSGQTVVVAETLANLGSACSTSNGNVRKHLHFGLYKGTAIDVRGYAPNTKELSLWVDPKELLSSLGAKQ